MGKPKMLGFQKPLPNYTRQYQKAPWQRKRSIMPCRENRCVCCGAIIPEGRQVCPHCEKRFNGRNNQKYCSLECREKAYNKKRRKTV